MTMQGTPPAFHLLAKPTGPICNLDCEYCFFLSKEMLYPGDRFRMADEMLEEYVRQLLESHRTPEVTVAWQGGEPTMMGLDFFKRSVELVDRYRRPTQRIDYTIQTNGVLIDERWAAFFKENNFLVGLSVDGPRDIHDAYRVDKGGKGTFDQVMAAARLLTRHKVEFNILCTVHAANGDHPLEVYRFGTGPDVRVMIAGIHGGYEWNTVALADALIGLFGLGAFWVPFLLLFLSIQFFASRPPLAFGLTFAGGLLLILTSGALLAFQQDVSAAWITASLVVCATLPQARRAVPFGDFAVGAAGRRAVRRPVASAGSFCSDVRPAASAPVVPVPRVPADPSVSAPRTC